MTSKFISQMSLFSEQLKEDKNLDERELYLRLKKAAIQMFNEAVEANDVEKMNDMKQALENLEIAYRTGTLMDILFSDDDFEQELETEKKRLEEQEKKEVHNEFIKPRELKEGEIDVNTLPL